MSRKEDDRLGKLFEKLFPNQYIELAKTALETLEVSFMMQALQIGGVYKPSVRQQDKCDSLQRLEHIVDGLDAVADAPVAYACAVMTCGCALLETMQDHLQHFCDEHANLVGNDNETLKGFTAQVLFDAYKDERPEIAREYRDAHLKGNVVRDADINISDTMERQLLDLLGSD